MTPRPCNDYSCYGALEIVGAITIITITISVYVYVYRRIYEAKAKKICGQF